MIEGLRVRGLRNLAGADVEPNGRAVLLIGGNGAGKTTVLEAVYLLARGCSFRGRRHGPLVARGADAALITAWVGGPSGPEELCWDSRQARGFPAVGGRDRLSVRLISAATPTLVEGDPSLRRRFIDWTLFHVEHRFPSLWSDFRRVSAQRNAWLRSGGTGAAVWDQPYAELMGQLGQLRRTLAEQLAGRFVEVREGLDLLPGLILRWDAPPDDPAVLTEQLATSRPADIARGHTWLSPARADLSFRLHGCRWLGSRGESKVAGILLQLAAERVRRSACSMASVWLVDDVGAELATELSRRLVTAIQAEAAQVWLTALPNADLARFPPERVRLFHVEQGRVIAIR